MYRIRGSLVHVSRRPSSVHGAVDWYRRGKVRPGKEMLTLAQSAMAQDGTSLTMFL